MLSSIRHYTTYGLFILLTSICSVNIAANTPTDDLDKMDDPWESFNRIAYRFNATLDHWIVKPVALGYRAVTPDIVEAGISNIFANLLELRNIANSVLQAKPQKAMDYTGRFILNSTFGLFGVLDIATPLGIDKGSGEDFGQTLAVWGVSSGPYWVIPLFGPSTLRDGITRFTIDDLTSAVSHIDHDRTRLSLTALNLIDARVSLLEAEQLISGDEYVFVRDAYLQRREFLIKDGVVEDSFGGDIESGDF